MAWVWIIYITGIVLTILFFSIYMTYKQDTFDLNLLELGFIILLWPFMLIILIGAIVGQTFRMLKELKEKDE